MEPTEIVRQLWHRTQDRDWDGVGALLADDVVVEWPASGERIVGRANYVGLNSTYPEGWSIHVLRVVADGGDQVVSEVEVPHEEMGTHRVASFWTVRDGVIVEGREYWTELGTDPVPQWREKFVQRM
ncbi:nuclear transport factor 2 family protein [Actinomycetota bacterium Odt1-20B]